MVEIIRWIKRVYRLIRDRHYKKKNVINGIYKVEKVLGVGSYGTSYLCQRYNDEEKCVVKQMTKSKKQHVISAMYKQEIEILQQLNHPNIPRLMETFIFQDYYFFAMQYIQGENLEDVLFYHNEKYYVRDALKLVRKLVLIVEYIHSKGVVHGDLRIPNIMICDDKPYIIDFGLSKKIEDMSNINNKVELWRQDFYDVGELLLFLLYSNYSDAIKKGRAWTEELDLDAHTHKLLKRLLGIDQPYSNTKHIIQDMDIAINGLH